VLFIIVETSHPNLPFKGKEHIGFPVGRKKENTVVNELKEYEL